MIELLMRLESNSKKVLAATKSRAKQIEFEIEPRFHEAIAGTPQNLLILSIAILGELPARERTILIDDEISGRNNDDLCKQLILAAQYFDSLEQSGLESEMSVYLRIVGAAAYYLADMPGSATVLSKKLTHEKHDLTPHGIEGPLIWMLRVSSGLDAEMQYSNLAEVNQIIFSYSLFLKAQLAFESLEVVCNAAERRVYEIGTDRELLFIDVLIALTKRRVRNSARVCLPRYSAMPLDIWKNALEKPGFILELWPAQRILGEMNVLKGKSAVVQMPTSAGKTKSTELLIRSSFLSGRSQLAVIIAPFRALCREIADNLEREFDGENIFVNELLDAPQIGDRDLEFLRFLLGEKFIDPRQKKTVLVSTPEKMVYLLRQKPELAKKIGLLILDEGHQFDTGQRGVTYELLISALRTEIPKETQTVLISAVLGNAETIGQWLYGENGVEIHGADCLPTVRSVAFASWREQQGELNYIDDEAIAEREFRVPQVITQVNLGKRGKERVDRLFPIRKDSVTVTAYLGLRLSQLGTTAVYCGIKQSVNAICDRIIKSYERGLTMPKPLDRSQLHEITKLTHLSTLHFGSEDISTRAIAIGVLPHSKAIPNGMRAAVEFAIANESARMVVCTSTLSQGVNLPIKYLVVSSIWQATAEIKWRDFQNLMGRAGRSGYHTEGSIIFSDLDIYELKNTWKGKKDWDRTLRLLDTKQAEDCISSLAQLVSPTPILDWDILKYIRDADVYRIEIYQQFYTSEKILLSIKKILSEIDVILQKIESYMLAFLKDNPGKRSLNDYKFLAEETLAYHGCSEEERLLLVNCFEAIAERVLNVPVEKIEYYGKALLGIAILEKLEDWIRKNIFELALCSSSVELLETCWPVLRAVYDNEVLEKIRPQESLLSVAVAWIQGKSYVDLLNIFESASAYSQSRTRQNTIK